jgi:hypothetical protein
VDEGDATYWNAMANYIMTHDMTIAAYYNQVKNLMDIENFITYLGHCIYTCKWDWPNNNDGTWRPKVANAKWKWIQFDMETCFGVGKELGPEFEDLDAEYNMLEHVFEGIDLPTFGQYGPHHLAQRLIQNAEFRDQFINWFAIHMQQELLPANMNARLDSMVAELQPYMAEYRNRWPFEVYFNNDWNYSIQLIRDFIQLRPQYMNQHLLAMFGTTSVENINPDFNHRESFYVDQNWPNPVKTGTRIRFRLPYSCPVRITLHNLAGQEIEIITNTIYPEGEHVIHWNRKDVPPGTYLYRFVAGECTETRKMIILK